MFRQGESAKQRIFNRKCASSLIRRRLDSYNLFLDSPLPSNSRRLGKNRKRPQNVRAFPYLQSGFRRFESRFRKTPVSGYRPDRLLFLRWFLRGLLKIRLPGGGVIRFHPFAGRLCVGRRGAWRRDGADGKPGSGGLGGGASGARAPSKAAPRAWRALRAGCRPATAPTPPSPAIPRRARCATPVARPRAPSPPGRERSTTPGGNMPSPAWLFC